MAETVMTIIWNVFQKDCQIVMCDVIVDWPRVPSECSSLMLPNSLFCSTLYFLTYLLNTFHPLQSSICCLCFTFSIALVSQAYCCSLKNILTSSAFFLCLYWMEYSWIPCLILGSCSAFLDDSFLQNWGSIWSTLVHCYCCWHWSVTSNNLFIFC